MQTTLQIPVKVSGRNIEVTPALLEHATEKVQKALRMFADHPTAAADVVLHVGKQGHTAEVTASAGGYFLRGESTTSDMYHSINLATARIEGQLRKFKARLARKGAPGMRTMEHQSDNGSGAPGAAAEAMPQVVRRKRFIVKPMDQEEAVLQMELLGHDFFVYLDAESNRVNVLYRRHDGGYGLLDPVMI